MFFCLCGRIFAIVSSLRLFGKGADYNGCLAVDKSMEYAKECVAWKR